MRFTRAATDDRAAGVTLWQGVWPPGAEGRACVWSFFFCY